MRPKYSEDRNLKMMCDVIFSLFTFLYLYFFQRDLLGMMYAMLPAADLLSFSPLVVSLLLTLIIVFLGLQIGKILRFNDMWYACNYLPSAFLLGLCTSCDKEYFFNLTEKSWYIVLLLFLLVIGVLKVISMIPQGRNNLMKWPYAILLLMLTCCVTLFIGNTDEYLHRELKIATLIEKGEYKKALQVGVKAEETTPELVILRAEAMLNLPSDVQGSQIAELFFDYPISNPSVVADSLYACSDTILQRKKNAELMAMLVQKDLQKFSETINSDIDNSVRLSSWYPGDMPEYYMQALVIYQYLTDIEMIDAKELYPTLYNKVVGEFEKYQATKKEYYIYSEQNRKNRLYMNYGSTYWWYFDFQD